MDIKDAMLARHELLKTIRTFFYEQGYIEVETPNLTSTCAPDPYIEPLKVYIGKKGPFYLHTSPEMGMKKLLRYNLKRIFQICKVYRIEEIDATHSIEFTMLEWYREGSYKDLIYEVGEMIRYIAEKLHVEKDRFLNKEFKVYELEGLFTEITGINPFILSRSQFIKAVRQKNMVRIDKKDTWNDIFFKIFIQEIEPVIKEDLPYFVIDWPSSISSMAKPKGKNKVERFEMYINGLEIANGYTELMDSKTLKGRFKKENLKRKSLGKDVFNYDSAFLKAIDMVEGDYAGVSIGIDRLLMAFMEKEKIDDVLPFRLKI
ncbi:MAG TPA: EF-P lysine aminoacylase EpmA [Syntrophorhabdaceae bacterium]|nr:EF-P lysine aminoacylase EpmA [Syntrophorhabdaceae bacterium]HPP05806.1 EF-P lysine aminoacylase EpmA [Syntrophorhabdaceae bacterium]